MKDSNISYQKDINMYKQDMWFYSKCFDFLIYDNNDIQKSFGNIPNWIEIDSYLQIKNHIIWITDFFGHKIVCIQNLETFQDKYYTIQSWTFFSFNIKNQDFFAFVYKDLKGDIWYITDLDLSDFEIRCNKEKFEVENKIFASQIFQKELNIARVIVESEKPDTMRGYTDVLDLFFFPDLFEKDIICDDLYNMLDWLEGQLLDWKFILNIEKYDNKKYPLWKINIRVKVTELDKVDFRNILALFLSYYPNQYLVYTIQNDNIISQMKRFVIVTKSDVNRIHLDFTLPENIMYYDENFIKFQQDFMKLKYGFYIMKENHNMLESMSNMKSDNPHFQSAQVRIDMNKESLSKVISVYEKTFNKLIDKLIKIKKS